MKTLVILVLLAIAGWWLYGWLNPGPASQARDSKKSTAPAPSADNTVTRYTNTLQQDVNRAQQAAVKATSAIKQEAQDAQKGFQESEIQ